MTSAEEELARLRRALESTAEAAAELAMATERAGAAEAQYAEALAGSTSSSATEALSSAEQAREKLTEAAQSLESSQKNAREYATEAHGADLAAPRSVAAPVAVAAPAADDESPTEPSGPPDPNAVPDGEEELAPRASRGMQENLRFQDEAAHTFARAGYRVRRLQRSNVQRSPDFDVEGRVFDCYQAGPDTSLDNIRTKMRSKGKDRRGRVQSRRSIVGLERSRFEAEDLREYLARNPSSRIQEAFVIKHGAIIRVWP